MGRSRTQNPESRSENLVRRGSPTPPKRAMVRRGVAVLIALAVTAIASLLVVLMFKLAIARHETLRTESARLQAQWLAESGFERAVARLATDAAYPGETWSLDAESLGRRDPGRVQIDVVPAPDRPARRTIRVVADYPDDALNRVRITIERQLPTPYP